MGTISPDWGASKVARLPVQEMTNEYGAADLAAKISEAEQKRAEAHGEISQGSSEAASDISREWSSAQLKAQSEFCDHQDRQKLQTALEEANQKYWDAVREVNEEIASRQRAAHNDHVAGLKKLATETLGKRDVDSQSLLVLAQALTRVAQLNPGRQQQAGAAAQAPARRAQAKAKPSKSSKSSK